MRIPDDIIDAVRAATDIVDVVGSSLPLTKAGKRFKCHCPFHTEKTASFMVNPETQMFHCFGCGVGGNVFTFLMRHQGLTFPEAVEHLANQAGISLPKREGDERAAGLQRLYAAVEASAAIFEEHLWHEQHGAKARRYLEERGVSVEAARGVRMGYALPRFDDLRNRLGRQYSPKELIEAGLLVDRDGGRPYDRFRDRIIFPITGSGGRAVAFGARCLDGSEPKYLNSPETPVYRKREVLYGLQLARRAIMDEQTTWVVEGYMDVLGLRQAGIEHVVAVSGTALSEAQARLLQRHAHRVVLLFDGDSAGRKAVSRSLPALMAEGLDVRVALLPQGEDPDSLARSGGRAAVDALVRAGSDVVDFIVSLCQNTTLDDSAAERPAGARERVGLLSEARADALRQLIDLARVVPDVVARRLLVEEASRRLDFDEATMWREVDDRRRAADRRSDRGARQPTGARPLVGPPKRKPATTIDRRYSELLTLALNDRDVLDRVRDELAPEDVPDGPMRRLFGRMLERYDTHGEVMAADFAADVQDPDEAAVLSSLAIGHVPDDRVAAAGDLLQSLLDDARRRQIATLKQEIQENERDGRDDEVLRLMARVRELLGSGPG